MNWHYKLMLIRLRAPLVSQSTSKIIELSVLTTQNTLTLNTEATCKLSLYKKGSTQRI